MSLICRFSFNSRYQLRPVSAKFIWPSDRQDKYVIGPICLISSRTEMSNVASMYTQSQTDYIFGPMKCFSKQDRMSYEVPQSFADTVRQVSLWSRLAGLWKVCCFLNVDWCNVKDNKKQTWIIFIPLFEEEGVFLCKCRSVCHSPLTLCNR